MLTTKQDEEIATLKETSQAWNVNKVLFYLHALVDKSCIVATLKGESPKSAFASNELYKMMGYFALVGLLRVQCLLGDYRLALSTIAPMDLSKKGLFTRVTACHISVFYYVGFAYLMVIAGRPTRGVLTHAPSRNESPVLSDAPLLRRRPDVFEHPLLHCTHEAISYALVPVRPNREKK